MTSRVAASYKLMCIFVRWLF